MGRHCFRLSSDTIYFLEEIEPEPAGGRPASGEDAAASGFTYVCGSPDALVRALQDLGRRCGPEPFRNEDPLPFRARAN
ncbi:MAG: hypothetical protein HY509_00355 [Acidobacteria bacterium]|nr:hypothetical protein [Acidobacteriota bacterium]